MSRKFEKLLEAVADDTLWASPQDPDMSAIRNYVDGLEKAAGLGEKALPIVSDRLMELMRNVFSIDRLLEDKYIDQDVINLLWHLEQLEVTASKVDIERNGHDFFSDSYEMGMEFPAAFYDYNRHGMIAFVMNETDGQILARLSQYIQERRSVVVSVKVKQRGK